MFPKNCRILVVDDMSAMRQRIVNQLKTMGYTRVIQAANGQEALTALERLHADNQMVDLVISDWNMPEMSGLDFLLKLKSAEAHSKVPFIMVTAEGEKQQVLKAIVAGVSDYLVKPVAQDVLQKKMQILGAKIYPSEAAV